MHNLLLVNGYVDFDVVIHMNMVVTVFLLNHGNMDHLLLVYWHMNIDVVIDVDMVMTVLLLNHRNMYNLLDCHGDGYIYESLNGLVLNSSLMNDFRYMDYLLDNMLHRFMDDLVDFLHGMRDLHLWNLVHSFYYMHCVDLLHLLLDWPHHCMLLIYIQILCRHFLFASGPLVVLGRSHFVSLHCCWVMDRECGLFVHFLVHARVSDLVHDAAVDMWVHLPRYVRIHNHLMLY